MTILLTGGAGFIGSAVAKRLLAAGHTVLIADNFNPSYDPALKWQHIHALQGLPNWQLCEGDIRQPTFLDRLFGENGIDGVIHLAGLTGVRASLRDPTAYFDHNLNGTSVLLEAMRRAGVNRFVFASSSSVYGERTADPFSETDRTDKPVSPYALSKRAAELLCYQHHLLYGLSAYCLRLFTVYGPGQRPDMALSRFVDQLMTGQPLTLYGDGRSRRDYTYVGDVVTGIERAIECVDGYELINIGSANPISLADVVSLLEQLTGRRAVINRLARQEGDVGYTHANIHKARHLLGYQPATDIRTGLSQMISHYEQSKSLVTALR